MTPNRAFKPSSALPECKAKVEFDPPLGALPLELTLELGARLVAKSLGYLQEQLGSPTRPPGFSTRQISLDAWRWSVIQSNTALK